MEIRIAYSDTKPRQIRIGYNIVLVATNIMPYSYQSDDGEVSGYAYHEYALSPAEYQEIQYDYDGDDPVLRIVHLKFLLAETDYVVAKIAEAEDQTELREEYAQVLADRQAWRDEIQSLGG